MLQFLDLNQLYAKRSKCIFVAFLVEYLGYFISSPRVKTDLKKVQAV